MTVDQIRVMLLGSALVNYGLLLLWFGLYVGARDRLQRLWGRWFRLDAETFDRLNFAGITLYKLLILTFLLVPGLVLWLVVG